MRGGGEEREMRGGGERERREERGGEERREEERGGEGRGEERRGEERGGEERREEERREEERGGERRREEKAGNRGERQSSKPCVGCTSNTPPVSCVHGQAAHHTQTARCFFKYPSEPAGCPGGVDHCTRPPGQALLYRSIWPYQ